MTTLPLRALLRHLLAWGGTTAVWLIVWTGTYLLLLFWALLANAGIGSPIVYPAGLLLILLLHSAAVLLVFLPATLLSEILCLRKTLPRIRAGLPLALFFVLLLLALLAVPLSFSGTSPDKLPYPQTLLGLVLLLALPMGLYWWASQFPALLHGAVQRIWKKLRP